MLVHNFRRRMPFRLGFLSDKSLIREPENVAPLTFARTGRVRRDAQCRTQRHHSPARGLPHAVSTLFERVRVSSVGCGEPSFLAVRVYSGSLGCYWEGAGPQGSRAVRWRGPSSHRPEASGRRAGSAHRMGWTWTEASGPRLRVPFEIVGEGGPVRYAQLEHPATGALLDALSDSIPGAKSK